MDREIEERIVNELPRAIALLAEAIEAMDDGRTSDAQHKLESAMRILEHALETA